MLDVYLFYTMSKPYIISLPSNRVWRTYPGGKILDRIEGKAAPQDSHFPEDWIGSVTLAKNIGREDKSEEGLSVVEIDGAQQLLKDVFEEQAEFMLGKSHYEKYGAVPFFLLKFLDSQIRLHVQAHPTIPFAQEHLNSNSGKTEGYYILETRPEVEDPCIFLGFKSEPSRDDMKSWVETQNIDAMLNTMHRITVKPGDSFIVPGGFPHAIGAGVLMVEIMEPTDFAVRLEFERGGYVLPEPSRFMNRDVDFALDMLALEARTLEELQEQYFVKPRAIADSPAGCRRESLIDDRFTGCFRVERWKISDACSLSFSSFFMTIVLNGAGRLRAGDTTLDVKKWDKAFITHAGASTGLNVIPNGLMELLCVFPPL
jgi:mannose-6-phosphate isomerase